jgi:hypothetical protein
VSEEDRERLDRIEALLEEVLRRLDSKPRKVRSRGPKPPDQPVSQADLDAIDARLAAAGHWRR